VTEMGAAAVDGVEAMGLDSLSRYGYYSHMKRASISEAKNQLSALLDRVRHGETVIIEDRGMPVARLEPMMSTGNTDVEGRVARLVRQGVLREPTMPPSREWLNGPFPALPDGVSAVDIISEERRNGR
jgi:prevent-host-death family protein